MIFMHRVWNHCKSPAADLCRKTSVAMETGNTRGVQLQVRIVLRGAEAPSRKSD